MNFNDYYNYINGYSEMNYMTNPNQMIEDLNYQSLMPNNGSLNNNQNKNILDSLEGFKRGNMFSNIYDEYKNYKPKKLAANNEREDMLMQLQEYSFAIIDLGLYLDTNPNDRNALNLFNEYLNKKKDLVSMYEEKNGPLSIDSMVQNNSWKWDNSPWPWEVQK